MSRQGILCKVATEVLSVLLLGLLVAACSQKVYPGKQPTGSPTVSPMEDDNIAVIMERPPRERMDSNPNEREKQSIPDDDVQITHSTDEMHTHYVERNDLPDTDLDTDLDDDVVVPARPSGRTGTKPARTTTGDVETEPEMTKRVLNADDYTVALDVTKEIFLDSKATLRVWIGKDVPLPKQIPSTVRDTSTIPANIGDYARITPFAPDFEVGPEESQTMHIDPSGASVLFYLTPTKQGEFLISAKIELYDNPDLEGVAVPKTSEIVSVLVTVDKKAAVKSRFGQLGNIAWDEFVKFWGALVALLFGVALFVVRKFFRKKTGYDGSGESTPSAGSSDAVESFDTEGSADAGESSETGDLEDAIESGDESDGADV